MRSEGDTLLQRQLSPDPVGYGVGNNKCVKGETLEWRRGDKGYSAVVGIELKRSCDTGTSLGQVNTVIRDGGDRKSVV